MLKITRIIPVFNPLFTHAPTENYYLCIFIRTYPFIQLFLSILFKKYRLKFLKWLKLQSNKCSRNCFIHGIQITKEQVVFIFILKRWRVKMKFDSKHWYFLKVIVQNALKLECLKNHTIEKTWGSFWTSERACASPINPSVWCRAWVDCSRLKLGTL